MKNLEMKITCKNCHVEYDVPCTDAQYKSWKDGELIQRAMPNLTDGQREILNSGICGTCFDVLFVDEEDPNEEDFTEDVTAWNLFRELQIEEEKEFRQWARDNYEPWAKISDLWHPFVQDECNKINKELLNETP